MIFNAFGQESYNLCSQALQLCPGEQYTVNNVSANSTLCANCEDDFNFCFSGQNTVWFFFETNALGGDVQLFFDNLIFQNNPGQGNALQATVIQTANPCIASSYNLASNCASAETTNFVLNATGLAPFSQYYVVVNGAMGTTSNAEATFNIWAAGPGIDRNPSIAIGTSAGTACLGETITLTAFIQNCDIQGGVRWYADGVLIGETATNQLVTSSLTQDVLITAETDCFEDCTVTITSPNLPISIINFIVDAGPDFNIIAGETVQLQGFTDQTDFEWSPPLNMSDPFVLNPVVGPNQTIIYYLTASNGICSITDFCEVRVISALEIPNTFTPNGDGVNDTWEIPGIELFPDCLVQVYDRWGQLVFQSSGYPPSKRWDGRSQGGRELAPSSYYYVINLRSEEFPDPIKGFVSIVR
jgi:gliding motility-associated-like protein